MVQLFAHVFVVSSCLIFESLSIVVTLPVMFDIIIQDIIHYDIVPSPGGRWSAAF